MKALSVRQPWAWAFFAPIAHPKDVENRDWFIDFHGRLAIHAAKGCTRDEYEDALDWMRHVAPEAARACPAYDSLVRGAVIGTVVANGGTRRSSSRWFVGPCGLLVSNPQELAVPVPVRGALGFWEWDPQAARAAPDSRQGELCLEA